MKDVDREEGAALKQYLLDIHGHCDHELTAAVAPTQDLCRQVLAYQYSSVNREKVHYR